MTPNWIARSLLRRTALFIVWDMIREWQKRRVYRPTALRFFCFAGAFFLALLTLATAQDIRGLEICTAEKQMERRTGCLQSNVEFLQQALTRLASETQEKIATVDRDLSAAQAEIAELKLTVAKLNTELARIKAKAEPSGKKQKDD